VDAPARGEREVRVQLLPVKHALGAERQHARRASDAGEGSFEARLVGFELAPGAVAEHAPAVAIDHQHRLAVAEMRALGEPLAGGDEGALDVCAVQPFEHRVEVGDGGDLGRLEAPALALAAKRHTHAARRGQQHRELVVDERGAEDLVEVLLVGAAVGLERRQRHHRSATLLAPQALQRVETIEPGQVELHRVVAHRLVDEELRAGVERVAHDQKGVAAEHSRDELGELLVEAVAAARVDEATELAKEPGITDPQARRCSGVIEHGVWSRSLQGRA